MRRYNGRKRLQGIAPSKAVVPRGKSDGFRSCEHEHLSKASDARRRNHAAPMSVRRSNGFEHPSAQFKSGQGPAHFRHGG